MADFDSPWKMIIEQYFKPFMAFFFPKIHQDIDWSRDYTFLDRELEAVVRDAESGKRHVDKLVRVYLRDGLPSYIYIHLEVQSQAEPGFEKRIYVYNYRLHDRYDHEVVSLAILGDSRPKWRPNRFRYAKWGFKLEMSFPVVKLLDYRDRWATMEASNNPFALMIMAHLKSKETRNQPRKRLNWKLQLTKSLYRKGYVKQEILDLFLFIDWVIDLPRELDKEFITEIEAYEGARKMAYITSVERIGIEKGLERGLRQGLEKGKTESLAAALSRILAKRFGALPAWAREKIAAANYNQLETWFEVCLDKSTIEEIFT